MDAWEVALLVVGGYIAVVSLVRLMAQRRRQTMQRFRQAMGQPKGRSPESESGSKTSGRRTA